MESIGFACGSCGQRLEESDSFCRHCGQPAPPRGTPKDPFGGLKGGGPERVPGSAKESPPSNERYLALMRADIYRLRRQWHLAEVECGEVLRRAPDNADAYSVMGDIYRDQGKLRDAIEWYRLALDRNPSSVADRRKLEALIDKAFPGKKQESEGGLVSALRRGLGGEGATPARHPCSLTAAVALALAVVFAIAVYTAMLGGRTPSSSQGPGAGGQPAPPGGPGGFAATTQGGSTAPAGEGHEQREGPAVDDEVAGSLVAWEGELWERLHTRARATDLNCQLTWVEIDPRDMSASVYFTMPRGWSPAAQVRGSVLRAAAALASEVLADEDIALVKLRCDLRPPPGEDETVMLARADRKSAAEGRGEEGIFSFLWWRPELRAAPEAAQAGPEG